MKDTKAMLGAIGLKESCTDKEKDKKTSYLCTRSKAKIEGLVDYEIFAYFDGPVPLDKESEEGGMKCGYFNLEDVVEFQNRFKKWDPKVQEAAKKMKVCYCDTDFCNAEGGRRGGSTSGATGATPMAPVAMLTFAIFQLI